ncbi:hypothetical protein BD324DRAFT_651176 [Kockovaella imperatae]|uniref:Uncharacterized protein n=1 Tax=Kockovaella imperatae TaxID=4999 RepID=A0A1Y1UF57_9TREE|nr:hypothetical protein BD324DRAFT_651176 [Kockovaella imperatae]ORX36690.1 hypothetical protein BD324DRAFT_651176 [Kockovaella imperatae]
MDYAMDSPTTRSRTKRGLEEAGSGLSWKHELDLRKELLESAEQDNARTTPLPSQKARPACSLLAFSPSQRQLIASTSREPGPSSLGPKRKRPNRSQRATNFDPKRNTSSAPVVSGNSSSRIELASVLGQLDRGRRSLRASLFPSLIGENVEVDSLRTPRNNHRRDVDSPTHGVLAVRSSNLALQDETALDDSADGKKDSKLITAPTTSRITPQRQSTILQRHSSSSSMSSLISNCSLKTPKSPRTHGSGLRIGLRSVNAKTPGNKAATCPANSILRPQLPIPLQASASHPCGKLPAFAPTISPHSAARSRNKSGELATRIPAPMSADLHQPPLVIPMPASDDSDGLGDDSFDLSEVIRSGDASAAELLKLVDGI